MKLSAWWENPAAERNGCFEGNILFNGEEIRTKDKLWLRRKMSMLFQDSKPFPFSVEKNLTYAMEFYEKIFVIKNNVSKPY